MARGMIYEFVKTLDDVGSCTESDFYEAVPHIAEYVDDVKNPEERITELIDWMGSLGAETGCEEGTKYFVLTEKVKESYFKDNFLKVKELVENMTLNEFATSDLYTLRMAIMDTWGDAVYDGGSWPREFDRWLRDADCGIRWYIGNLVYMH